MGVIDCLSAGYRYLGWRFELILIPIVLDLLLWMGPRFNVAPLFDQFAVAYGELAAAEGVTPEIGQMVSQLSDSIRQMGEGSNLLNGLVSGSLLHVPSLPVVGADWLPHTIVDINTVGEAAIWWLVFTLLGLLIGVIYLTLLARRLPIGSVAGARTGQVAVAVLRHWLQVIGFVIVVALALLILYLPISFVVGLMMLGQSRIWFGGGGVGRGADADRVFYLYFVTAALIMGTTCRSMWRLCAVCVWCRRTFFGPHWALSCSSSLIGLGIALVLVQVANIRVWTALAAIVVNHILTRLEHGAPVFYRSRFIKGADMAQF